MTRVQRKKWTLFSVRTKQILAIARRIRIKLSYLWHDGVQRVFDIGYNTDLNDGFNPG